MRPLFAVVIFLLLTFALLVGWWATSPVVETVIEATENGPAPQHIYDTAKWAWMVVGIVIIVMPIVWLWFKLSEREWEVYRL